jgi:hypothetical protein
MTPYEQDLAYRRAVQKRADEWMKFWDRVCCRPIVWQLPGEPEWQAHTRRDKQREALYGRLYFAPWGTPVLHTW